MTVLIGVFILILLFVGTLIGAFLSAKVPRRELGHMHLNKPENTDMPCGEAWGELALSNSLGDKK